MEEHPEFYHPTSEGDKGKSSYQNLVSYSYRRKITLLELWFEKDHSHCQIHC
jgi:hypothetical protein